MSNLKQKQEKMCNSQWMLIQYLLAQWWHIVVSKFSSLLTCWCLELFFTFWENLFSSSYCTYQQEVLENLTFVNSTNFLSSNDFAFASELFTHTFFSAECKNRIDSNFLTLNSSSLHIVCLPQTATIPATIDASPSSSWTAAQMESYQRNRGICWMTPLRRTQMWWEAIHCLHKVYMTVFLFCYFEDPLTKVILLQFVVA